MPRAPQRIALFVVYIELTIKVTPGPFKGCDTERGGWVGLLKDPPLHGLLWDFRTLGHGYSLCRPQRLSMYPVAFPPFPVWTPEVEPGMLDS